MASKKILTEADAFAPTISASTMEIRNAHEPLKVYEDGTILLPKQLTHNNTAKEVKLAMLAKELKIDFDGPESEDNWTRRETNVIILRKLTASTIPTDRTAVYIAAVKGLLDGIVKSATSLRTSLSLQGCALIEEATKAAGHGLDQSFDILYPPLEKHCCTKPSTAQAASNAVLGLITNITLHSRVLESVCASMESKNKSLRGCAIGWIDSLITTHAGKTALESGVELIERTIRKALSDADSHVRERSRSTFWTYSTTWKTKGEL